jgi:pyruvate, water dikinase
VAPRAVPDLVIVFDRIRGLVTDHGGRLAHAVVVARERGLPVVVATETATTSVLDGSVVDVDGSAGTVAVLEGPSTWCDPADS